MKDDVMHPLSLGNVELNALLNPTYKMERSHSISQIVIQLQQLLFSLFLVLILKSHSHEVCT